MEIIRREWLMTNSEDRLITALLQRWYTEGLPGKCILLDCDEAGEIEEEGEKILDGYALRSGSLETLEHIARCLVGGLASSV